MQHGVSSEASPLIPEPSSTVQTNNNNNNNTGDNTSSVEALQTARRLLYTSHCSAQFSEQTWQFSLLLFLTALTNYSSVFLVSSYGLVSGLVVCLAGPAAGRFFVDNKLRRCDRLTAAQFLIGSQNMSVLLATACCYFLLLASQQQQSDEEGMQKAFEKNHDETTLLAWVESTLQGVPLDYSSVWLIVGVHIFGSLAQILDTAFLVTIERDWVVVMHNVSTFVASVNTDGSEDGIGNGSQTIHHSSGSGVSWLAETNVVMKQIDLSCKVAAPAIAGFFIGAAKAAPAGATSHQQQQYPNDNGAYDLATAALIVGMINAMSLMVEYLCTARIYELVPALRVQTLEHPAPPSTPMLLSVQLLCGGNNTTETKVIAANAVIVDDTTGNNDNGHGVNRTQTAVPLDAQCGFFGAHLLPSGLQTFMNQRISWAGLGLAML